MIPQARRGLVVLALALGLAIAPAVSDRVNNDGRSWAAGAEDGPVPKTLLPPIDSFGEVLRRPVFSQSRRPGPGGGEDFKALKKEVAHLRLRGTVSTAGKELALFEDRKTNEFIRVTLGDQILGWDVASISLKRVVLSKSQTKRVFALRFE